MPHKLTYEYVKTFIENNNYELLSDTYINSKTKLIIKCNNGHTYTSHFNSFYNGNRCPVCFGTPKHTYEYIKSYIENNGFKLVSNTYISNQQLLELECDKGHRCKIRFYNFKAGTRCSKCSGTKNIFLVKLRSLYICLDIES